MAEEDMGMTSSDVVSRRSDQTGTSGYVDWDFAKATGRRLVQAGPVVTPAEAVAVVETLRSAAQRARIPVAETARMHSPMGSSPVLIVDRPGWIDANVDSLRSMLEPVVLAMVAKRRGAKATSPLAQEVGGKVTGAETGALMSFLASKVLGQYDLAPDGVPRLLLVAPNVLQAEHDMGVEPGDFRLWVCLHEETHRVQFTAVPWLRQHVVDSVRRLSLDLAPDPEQLGDTIRRLTENLPDALRSGGNGLTDIFATPEQRVQIAKVTAIMSLLEGHADVVMDDVGPAVVPSVDQIRARFQERRREAGGVDKILRRLLGLEAKMRQYRDGAAFVRAVTAKVGTEGFNEVWTSAETLPLPLEIENPSTWVQRIHG
ncbi:MAG: zinc-dependent metalloprotease [Dermatophilaceae bacterium]